MSTVLPLALVAERVRSMIEGPLRGLDLPVEVVEDPTLPKHEMVIVDLDGGSFTFPRIRAGGGLPVAVSFGVRVGITAAMPGSGPVAQQARWAEIASVVLATVAATPALDDGGVIPAVLGLGSEGQIVGPGTQPLADGTGWQCAGHLIFQIRSDTGCA